jgi:UDP-2-acetamido-3-amino-2,3-dideoxy-glucuronate N-acetyltransferase
VTDYFLHPSSFVDSGAIVGEGTKIWHFCHVMSGARIGKECNVGQNVFVASGVTIGDNVKIQNNVSLYTGVVVEDGVFLGPSVVLTNVLNPRSRVSRKDEFQQTVIRRGATIGANATILCGLTLGQHSFVGAGTVITRDLPDHALVYGAPARIRGWMCCCGLKLTFGPNDQHDSATCSECQQNYVKAGNVVRAVDPDGPPSPV